MLFYVLSFIVCLTLVRLFINNKKKTPNGLKEVPLVSGSLPIIGHGFSFSKDILAFVRNAYIKYGPIFRVKIFLTDMIIICDRSLIKDYFKAQENTMSLYEVLKRLFFADAFFDDPADFPASINLVKKTVAVRFDEFVPKIKDEAMKMIMGMREKCKNQIPVDLTTEMINFVSRTSARCFVGMDLSDEFMIALMKFTHILNKIVVLTYFIPRIILRYTLGYFWLRPYRKIMTRMLNDEIESYRDDPVKKTSMVIRASVDYIDQESGKGLNNEQIGDIIVCLLYVSSENTALGLSATMTELARSDGYWDKVKLESEKYLSNDDMRSLFSSPLIDACVMESARLTSHIFALNRKPILKNANIGGYFVGGVDTVALCEPMLMCYDCADDKYTNASKYDPSRFIEPRNEPKDAHSVMTWGASIHLCPGKMFAIYEIKMAMALLTTYFKKFNISDSDYGQLDYFSPSAFAERKVTVKLEPIEDDNIQVKKNENIHEILYNGKNINIEYIPQGGWLLRDFMDKDEQINFYKYTTQLSNETIEHNEILNASNDKAFPITYYNLVYTGTSNCENPTLWLEYAQKIWQILNDNAEKLNFPSQDYKFDSIYGQLYSSDAKMKLHKDEYVSWGVSVNIGASCDFQFGEQNIMLNSGDIIVADFSKVEHAVNNIHPDSTPQWFTDDKDSEHYVGCKTFGRCRFSMQIRNVSNCMPNKLMTIDEFKHMLGY
jgi:cytochrome P450